MVASGNDGRDIGRKNKGSVDQVIECYEELANYVKEKPFCHLVFPALLPDPENDQWTGMLN